MKNIPSVNNIVGTIVTGIVMALAVAFLTGWLTEIAWNNSLAVIWPASVPKIGFWVGYWLSFLSTVLFKGISFSTRSPE